MSKEIILVIIPGLIILGSLFAGALVTHGTIKKTKWGINFARVQCPECRDTLHHFKRLNWFGVWTTDGLGGRCNCQKCCLVVDKWGRKIATFKKER